MPGKSINKTVFNSFLVVNVILLSFFVISEQLRTVPWLNFNEDGWQYIRVSNILLGIAKNPWQYRPLAPFMINPLLVFLKGLGFSNYIAISLLSFRFVLDVSAFLLCFIYFKKLGFSPFLSLVGINILAWGMSYAFYDSDLSFNTILDVIFYLLAVLSILNRKINWVIPIMFFAALNRETSGLIPFLFFFSFHDFKEKKFNLKYDLPVFISIVIYVLIFVALRFIYPLAGRAYADAYGNQPGLEMLMYNLSRRITWLQLFATLGIMPLLALIGYSRWSSQLKTFFWIIVPIWVVIHMFGGVLAEARYFLVPQTIIFIPGVLLLIRQEIIVT